MDYVSQYIGNMFVYGKNVLNQKMVQENLHPIVILTTGFALKIFRYKVSTPIIMFSTSFFSGRLVSEIGHRYQFPLINKSFEQLRVLVKKNPKLKVFFLFFALITCKKTPKLSIATAVVAGLLASVHFKSKSLPQNNDDRAGLF